MKTDKFTYARVLQHDANDEIRIGRRFPMFDLDGEAGNVKKLYDEKLEWCGGFDASCDKYYKRIAIVDADTLAVLRVVYQAKEEE